LRGGQAAVAVEGERAGACVELVGAAAHDEEPIALDRQVRRPTGVLQAALAEVRGRAREAHAEADLRGAGAAALGGETGALEGLAQQVLEHGLAALEPDGVDVGDVVADDVDHRLVAAEPGDAGVHGAEHGGPFRLRLVQWCLGWSYRSSWSGPWSSSCLSCWCREQPSSREQWRCPLGWWCCCRSPAP